MGDGPKTLPGQPEEATSGQGTSSATLRDVAREAGVSPATASRVLNGSTRHVREGNASRVLAAAARLNYQPHLSAQAIARGSTKTAALVVRGIDDPYFSSVAAGVTERAESAGLIVTMAVAGRSPARELQIVQTLRGQRPRAIILAGSRVDGTPTRGALVEELEAYRTAGGRVVVISQHDLPFHTVSIDNYGGAQQLASALTELGYRRFAVIRAPDALRTSRDRYEGFLTGLQKSKIKLDDRLVVETEFTRSGGYEAARELVARGLGGAELVFAVNDVMATGAMTAFRDAGLVPGTDIAVAGFDDIASSVDLVPALTSVSVPLSTVGWTALDVAIDDTGADDVIRVATHVTLRESTPRLST